MTGLSQVALISAALAFVASWIGVVFLSPPSARAACTPSHRIAAARAWLYAPFWLPAACIALAFAPAVLAALTGGADHCSTASAHHHHMCFVHPPLVSHSVAAWLTPALVFVPMVLGLGLFVLRALRQERMARSLISLTRPAPCDPDALLLETDESMALTVGLWRPRVLLSSGLLARISAGTLKVILAHEKAHVRRRDTVLAVADRLVATLYPRVVCAPLLADIALGTEQACDVAAAEELGEVEVACALREVLRMGMATPAFGISIGSSPIEARVAYLLTPHKPKPRWLRSFVLGSGILVGAAGPMHAAVELLLCTLVH